MYCEILNDLYDFLNSANTIPLQLLHSSYTIKHPSTGIPRADCTFQHSIPQESSPHPRNTHISGFGVPTRPTFSLMFASRNSYPHRWNTMVLIRGPPLICTCNNHILPWIPERNARNRPSMTTYSAIDRRITLHAELCESFGNLYVKLHPSNADFERLVAIM